MHGYAKNLPDGRVEVLACGEQGAVEVFVQWLWEGSAASRVEAVQVSEAPERLVRAPAGFHTA